MNPYDYTDFLRQMAPPPAPPPRALKRKLDSYLSKTGEDEAVAGDAIMKQVYKLLDQFEGYERSDTQKTFHSEFIAASLPHIYGKDFERYRSRILSQHSLTELCQEILVCTPRRFGKTTCVSMFCAVMLYTVPNMWIAVFSTGQRASTSLLDLTAKFINMLENGTERILKKNQEQLFLKGLTPTDERRLFSYPSSVAGLKGVGGKIIILEEASRLDPAVFSEVITPLLGVKDTTLIGISTPLDSSNFYSVLLEKKKPSGQPLFKTLNITLVCPACRLLGELECLHASQLPKWKSGVRGELVKSLMEGDTEMFLRENAGVITTADHSALDGPGIARFSKRVYDEYKIDANTIYVVIDPNGGGASQFAVASFATTGGATLVVAADTKNISGDVDMEEFLTLHVGNVRAHHPLAKLVVIIERNFGGSVLTSRISNILAQYQPISYVSADPQGKQRIGIVTTNETKNRGRVDLQRMLRLDLIGYAFDFISMNKNMKDLIQKQLTDFKFFKYAHMKCIVFAILTPPKPGKNLIQIARRRQKLSFPVCALASIP